MILGELIGWAGVVAGLCVAPPQLIKIIKTNSTQGISIFTYSALVLALAFYLLHAIYIRSPVFVTAQAVNLVTNTTILIFLIKRRKRGV